MSPSFQGAVPGPVGVAPAAAGHHQLVGLSGQLGERGVAVELPDDPVSGLPVIEALRLLFLGAFLLLLFPAAFALPCACSFCPFLFPADPPAERPYTGAP